MIAPTGDNLLPPPPPNVTLVVFAIVAVVDDVGVVVVVFVESGAPLDTIEGLPQLVLAPVGT